MTGRSRDREKLTGKRTARRIPAVRYLAGENLTGKRIAGVLALLLWAALPVFLSGLSGKIAAASLLLFLAAACIYDINLPAKMQCRFAFPAYGEKEKNIVGSVRLFHNGIFPVLSGKVFLRAKSLFTGEEQFFSLEMKAFGSKDGKEKMLFALFPRYMGFLEVRALSVEVYGLLGIFRRKIPLDHRREVMILPKTTELDFPAEPAGTVLPFYEEGTALKKGYGAGEYSGIRPYLEGDPMRQIHWKLTGKTDELMVREMEVPVQQMALLFLETRLPEVAGSGKAGTDEAPAGREDAGIRAAVPAYWDAALIDLLLEAYFSVSLHMAEEGQQHCLCWWNESTGEWHSHRIQNAMQLEEVYGILFQTGLYTEGDPSLAFLPEAKKDRFSEILYFTGYVPEGADPETLFIEEGRKVTLLYGCCEKAHYEREELLPYLFTKEEMPEDLNRILTENREEWGDV